MNKIYAKKLHTVVAQEASRNLKKVIDRVGFDVLFHAQGIDQYFDRTVGALHHWAKKRSPKQLASAALAHLPATIKAYRAGRESFLARTTFTGRTDECSAWRQELGLSNLPPQQQIEATIKQALDALFALAPANPSSDSILDKMTRRFEDLSSKMLKGGRKELETLLNQIVSEMQQLEAGFSLERYREAIDGWLIKLIDADTKVKLGDDVLVLDTIGETQVVRSCGSRLHRRGVKPGMAARRVPPGPWNVVDISREVDTPLKRRFPDLEMTLVKKLLNQVNPEIEKVRSIRIIGRLLWVIMRFIGRIVAMRYYGVDSREKLAKRFVRRALVDVRGPLLQHVLTRSGEQIKAHILPKNGNPEASDAPYLGQALRALAEIPMDWIRPDRPIPSWALSLGIGRVKAAVKNKFKPSGALDAKKEMIEQVAKGWANEMGLRQTVINTLNVGIREGIFDANLTVIENANDNPDAILHGAVLFLLRNASLAQKIAYAKFDPKFAQKQKQKWIAERTHAIHKIETRLTSLSATLKTMRQSQDRHKVYTACVRELHREKGYELLTTLTAWTLWNEKPLVKEAKTFLKKRRYVLIATLNHHKKMLRELQAVDVVAKLQKERIPAQKEKLAKLTAKQGQGGHPQRNRLETRLKQRKQELRIKMLQDPIEVLGQSGDWLFHTGMGQLMQLIDGNN